ncbi:uncharacterized protein IL334_002994 [Kwoniella shivajii]|uniref:Fe2OG dioxygenase domain-containing protein n=1 Tax=Kwoniella shivajii TaxID=564305 RepID=A0ABZ1D0F7_9TREE|nr:hypothetical protein IL334_002994 [Kwoniella shivajii]
MGTQGNAVGFSKDLLQTTRANANDPSDLQYQRRHAAMKLLHHFEKNVLSRIKRWMHELDNERLTKGHYTSYSANTQARFNGAASTHDDFVHYQGLATAIAVGYGEAGRPHIDRNDDPDGYTYIIQLSGQSGHTRFPQLNLDVALGVGDVIIAPTASLLHHSLSIGTVQQDRITAVFYTCRHVSSLAGTVDEDGFIAGGVFDGIPADSLFEFVMDEL